jgi:benzoylformate decarboxylase
MRNGEYCILESCAVLEDTPGVPCLDIPDIDLVSIGTPPVSWTFLEA